MLGADPVSYAVAFTAGFVSFASPCVLPLVPAYLGFISGVGFEEGADRRRAEEQQPPRESQRVITVRMPQSLHESLKAEADQYKISINQLCIAKLLKYIDAQNDLPRKQVALGRKQEELEVDL